MAAIFDRLSDQRSSTCGAFALSYLLPAVGHAEVDGHDLRAEDYLAHLAAVVIEQDEVGPSAAVGARVAAGELSEDEAMERYPRTWYRYPTRASADPVIQGTSPTGIARAVALGSRGALASVPIPGRDPDGEAQLTASRWLALLDLIETRRQRWRLHVIFNYESDQLLKPDSARYTVEALRSPSAAEELPRDTWGVGHFAGLAGIVRRRAGGRWLILFDTYKRRGFQGYQPQPAELMRRGLIRSDRRGGGLLVVVPCEHVSEATAEIEGLGLWLGMWSNGSLEPDDWTWQRGR